MGYGDETTIDGGGKPNCVFSKAEKKQEILIRVGCFNAKNMRQFGSSSIIIHHHPSSSIIIHHHPSSSIIIHHHPSSSTIIHHIMFLKQ